MVKLYVKNCLPKNCIIFYDTEKFDQKYYHDYLKDELLNYDAKFIEYGLIKNENVQSMFIKPSLDLKYFAGTMIESGVVCEEISRYRIVDEDLTDHVYVMYTHNIIDNIDAEYRCFVVGGNIISISLYMENGKINPRELTIGEYNTVADYIGKIQQIYEPHDHYVIDVAKLGNEYKVVEYNCINCSGMYKNDRTKIYTEFLKL